MEIIIHPYQGIEIPGKGRISFGMTRKRVRSFFSEQPKAVMLGENDDVPTDSYDQASIRFFYKSHDLLQSIAIEYEHDLIFQEKHLLQTPYQQIKCWFKQLDPILEIKDYGGLTSHSFGISLWAPGADEEEDSIAESALVFERGYNQ